MSFIWNWPQDPHWSASLHLHCLWQEIQIQGENLEVVEEFKILGLVITSDMRWNQHVKYICQRGYAKLWFLRRLKKLGVSTHVLIDLYEKHIRSILEYAAPAWSPMLTAENKSDIERVQKCSYSIIFGPNRYAKTLNNNQKNTLEERRQILCSKFSVKASKSVPEWFCKKQKVVNTRNNDIYKEVPARCERWMCSPIPYLTKLLNNQ